MTEETVLICPKCQGAMRTYERSGVAIDQCTDCRGIFLDHGELQRLIYAESTWMGRRDGHPEAHGRDRDSEPARIRHRRERVPGVGDDDWRGHHNGDRWLASERRSDSRFGRTLENSGGDMSARSVR